MLLDGVHLVQAALDAAVYLDQVVIAASCASDVSEEGRLAHSLERLGVDVVIAADVVFEAVSPVRSPSGIAAIGMRRPVDTPSLCAPANAFVLAIAGVQDPGNVGALLRSAEAAGLTGAFVTAGSANPFSWKALRGSMGSALRLPIVAGLSPDEVMAAMTHAGMRTVAAVGAGGIDPDAASWRGRVGLWIGGEGAGLPEAVVARCDDRVTIPMASAVESLNAAAAGAVLVYAARRQRA